MTDFENGKSINISDVDGTNNMISEAFRFLEEGKWKSAEVFCDGILEDEPDNIKICLCKLLAKNHCKSKDELKELEKPFDNDPLYKKIVETGSIELKGELKTALLYIKARIAEKAEIAEQEKNKEQEAAESEEKANIYESAANKQAQDTIKSLKRAEAEFTSIAGWFDSDDRAEACRNRIKEITEKAEAEKAEKKNKIKISPKGIAAIALVVITLVVSSIVIFRPEDNNIPYLRITNAGAVSLDRSYTGLIPNKIVIPKKINGIKVRMIDANAFGSYSGLTHITIPNSVKTIRNSAFSYCPNLKSIIIPSSVTRIEKHAFIGCPSLTSITFEDTDTWYISQDTSYTDFEKISVTNSYANAEMLTDLYSSYNGYWFKE